MLKPCRLADLAHSAFAQIRHNGQSTPVIVCHLRKQFDVVLGIRASVKSEPLCSKNAIY